MALSSESKADVDPFEVGRVVSRSYVFTQENIAAFADMAGDPNPFHHDAEFAKGSRFGTIIASAAHPTGVSVSVTADKFAKNGEAVGLCFTFTLRRRVPAGAETDLEWTITSRYHSEKLNGIFVEVAGQIRDQVTGQVYVLSEGRMLLIGEAEIAVVKRQPLETRPE